MAATPVDGSSGIQQRADGLAQAYPPLMVAAERIAVSMVHGAHGRRRAGPGEDFWQYRPYSPGDAATRVDWRKSARAGRTLIRENEWAATNTLYVWASPAPGMEFRSHLASVSKHDRAILIAQTIATMAVRGGERIAVLGSPQPPGHTRLSLRRAAEWLSRDIDPATSDLPPESAMLRHASCLLLSDFLAPLDQLRARLTAIAATGVHGHLVQITDPAEETLPYEGRTEFVDVRGAGSFVAGRAETLRDAYAGRLALHRDGIRDLTRRLGWTFITHNTGQPMHPLLLSLYARIADHDASFAQVREA